MHAPALEKALRVCRRTLRTLVLYFSTPCHWPLGIPLDLGFLSNLKQFYFRAWTPTLLLGLKLPRSVEEIGYSIRGWNDDKKSCAIPSAVAAPGLKRVMINLKVDPPPGEEAAIQKRFHRLGAACHMSKELYRDYFIIV